jgi:mRNA interferase MazF
MAAQPRRTFPRRGEIYQVDFGDPQGAEQGGDRPALVVSNDVSNQRSQNVIVAAITTNLDRARYPQNVLLPAGDLPKDSVVLGEQLRTVTKQRLRQNRGRVTGDKMKEVNEALKTILELK